MIKYIIPLVTVMTIGALAYLVVDVYIDCRRSQTWNECVTYILD